VTFDEAAEAYLAAHESSWKSPVHRDQWRGTLRDYVSPVIGGKDVTEISADDVLKVLNPIWRRMPETASRSRGRVETVLNFAGCNGSNPAR